METLDWLNNQDTPEARITRDEIILLRQSLAHKTEEIERLKKINLPMSDLQKQIKTAFYDWLQTMQFAAYRHQPTTMIKKGAEDAVAAFLRDHKTEIIKEIAKINQLQS